MNAKKWDRKRGGGQTQHGVELHFQMQWRPTQVCLFVYRLIDWLIHSLIHSFEKGVSLLRLPQTHYLPASISGMAGMCHHVRWWSLLYKENSIFLNRRKKEKQKIVSIIGNNICFIMKEIIVSVQAIYFFLNLNIWRNYKYLITNYKIPLLCNRSNEKSLKQFLIIILFSKYKLFD
jgi:hypothetical protein